MPDQLRCNICGIILTAGDEGKHASTSSHKRHKSNLEDDLKAIGPEHYDNDSSVIVLWKKSV
ncbi:MAG: hypothetical protein ACREBU_02070 [Nitrososphaera sp.]